MVRIKHRYLLANILYPEITTSGLPNTRETYLSCHRPSPPHLSPSLFIAQLRNSISINFGDCGLGLSTGSLKVVYLSPATSTAIIRCSRQHFRLVWAALTLVTEIPPVRRGQPPPKCVIQVVRVSGTIRKSEEELLRRAKADIVKAKLNGELNALDCLIEAAEQSQARRGPSNVLSSQIDAHSGGMVEDDVMDELSE